MLPWMIDLHTHSLLSDGVLLPSELIVRARNKGVMRIAITDHVDASNIDFVIPRLVKVCKEVNELHGDIIAKPGAELTHLPPLLISRLSKEARNLGAEVVIVHGETIVEPVEEGTNWAAVNSDIDILAHPGLISYETAMRAKERNIALEITTRKGHSLTNGHVFKVAKEIGNKLVLSTDTHDEGDLVDINFAQKITSGAGISLDEFEQLWINAKEIFDKHSAGRNFAYT